MRYVGEGELKLKQKRPRWTNTKRAHCICGAGYVCVGFANFSGFFLCYGFVMGRHASHNSAIQDQADTEPQMPAWTLKYLSTAVAVFQLLQLLMCRLQIFFQKVSLLIIVCGSPFPTLATLCINLSSISDLPNLFDAHWTPLYFLKGNKWYSRQIWLVSLWLFLRCVSPKSISSQRHSCQHTWFPFLGIFRIKQALGKTMGGIHTNNLMPRMNSALKFTAKGSQSLLKLLPSCLPWSTTQSFQRKESFC